MTQSSYHYQSSPRRRSPPLKPRSKPSSYSTMACIVSIIIILVLIGVGGGAFWYFYHRKPDKKQCPSHKEDEAQPFQCPMDKPKPPKSVTDAGTSLRKKKSPVDVPKHHSSSPKTVVKDEADLQKIFENLNGKTVSVKATDSIFDGEYEVHWNPSYDHSNTIIVALSGSYASDIGSHSIRLKVEADGVFGHFDNAKTGANDKRQITNIDVDASKSQPIIHLNHKPLPKQSEMKGTPMAKNGADAEIKRFGDFEAERGKEDWPRYWIGPQNVLKARDEKLNHLNAKDEPGDKKFKYAHENKKWNTNWHFDWYMFPWAADAHHTFDFRVEKGDVVDLIKTDNFVDRYVASAKYLIAADYMITTRIRYKKIVCSMSYFMSVAQAIGDQDSFKKLKVPFEQLKDKKSKLIGKFTEELKSASLRYGVSPTAEEELASISGLVKCYKKSICYFEGNKAYYSQFVDCDDPC